MFDVVRGSGGEKTLQQRGEAAPGLRDSGLLVSGNQGESLWAANMGKDKPGSQSSQSKIDKYAVQSSQGGPPDAGTGAGIMEDNMAAKILNAIHDSRVALETQIGGVQNEVSLIRQDLRNTVYRVMEVEVSISGWKTLLRTYPKM